MPPATASTKNDTPQDLVAELVEGYISNLDWRVNENSNMTYSYQGLNNHLASSIQARYWLSKIYPENVARAHQNAEFHIHDLGSLCTYCCGWSIEDILMQGFRGVPGKVACAPAKHFRTALEVHEHQEAADPYYSNSSQLPVGATDDIFEALDKQDELQCKYTGGTVFHAFLGERMPSIESTKQLVKTVTSSYEMPYFSVTPTFSISPKYGYIQGEHEFCPKHDEDLLAKGEELDDENRVRCEVYSRVVGYIRPVQQWNKGKKSEWQHRQVYISPN